MFFFRTIPVKMNFNSGGKPNGVPERLGMARSGMRDLTFTTFTTFPKRFPYRIRFPYNPVPTLSFSRSVLNGSTVLSFVPSSRTSKP